MKGEISVVYRLAKLGLGVGQIEELTCLARRLSRLDERSCNGEIDGDRYENAVDSALLRAADIVKPDDLSVYHQSDPRGASLYVYRESDLNGSLIQAVYPTIGVAVY